MDVISPNRLRLRLTRGAGFAGSPGRMLRIREGSRVRLRLTGADASHPRSEIISKLQTVSLIVSAKQTNTKSNPDKY